MHDAKLNSDDNFNIWGSGNPSKKFLFVDDLSMQLSLINNEIEEELINIGVEMKFQS